MSWLSSLHNTYDNISKINDENEERITPLFHTRQKADINITLDMDGNFISASVKKESLILPATEDSSTRVGQDAPHPLADNLSYVAADYQDYGGRKKHFFESYKTQLTQWCESDFAHPKAAAVLKYISKGHVIKDLVDCHIIKLDDEMKMLKKNDEQKFEQDAAFICWAVHEKGNPNANCWEDLSLFDSWANYYEIFETKKGFCHISGEEKPIAAKHPKYILPGNGAKLISSDDKKGFKYRGRFIEPEQAAGISSVATQKVHNTLKWLIARKGQSFKRDSFVVTAWANSSALVAQPSDELFFDEEENVGTADNTIDFAGNFARRLTSRIRGYGSKIDLNHDQINIIALDTATPGRYAIKFFREYTPADFYKRIEEWHMDFSWWQRITKDKTSYWSICAPAPFTIANAAYGMIKDKAQSGKTIAKVYERLLPCIVDGAQFPIDLLRMCVARASHPYGSEHWEWQRNIGVACALYRGYHRRINDVNKRREYLMSLEKENRSRDYLYGRLLAVAERIERVALNENEKNRPTNAERYFQRFADKPCSTWRIIELALKPYEDRLRVSKGGFLTNRKKDIQEIMNLFTTETFSGDQKLSGEFLLGYHSQKMHDRPNHKNPEDKDELEQED